MASAPCAAVCYDRDASGRQTRFVLRGEEAFDAKPGLTWMRCGLGAFWNGRACEGEPRRVSLDEAEEAAKALGSKWRVPSGPELQSLVDRSCGEPVADRLVFPDIRADEEGTAPYWTIASAGVAGLYYFFDFTDGSADGHSRGFHLLARFVSGR